MSGDNRFTPKLGRPGNAGGRHQGRFLQHMAKEVARLRKGVKSTRRKSAGRGRGAIAGRMAQIRPQRFAAHRMRRVVVKSFIARRSAITGGGNFREHVSYIMRDGVERDGARGVAYDREDDRADAGAFKARGSEDRHQFRFIVSAEDADRLSDLKPHVRRLMDGMEHDLETRLDWIAVDHHDTGQPHTHIIVRGKEPDGSDLVIARDYLTDGLRRRACEQMTDTLGPRSELEILRQRGLEIDKDRMTETDRRLARLSHDNLVELAPTNSVRGEIDRNLLIRRLKHLASLRLATRLSQDRWALRDGWRDDLAEMGRQGDVIRTVAAQWKDHDPGHRIDRWDASIADAPVIGRVTATGAEDELRTTRWVAVEALDGRVWQVSVADNVPPIGAVVELEPRKARPRQADRTIARIAALNGGRWSEDIHVQAEPDDSSDYINAHKRRLEALRRAGAVSRDASGVWTIGDDYLEQARRYEARRETGAPVRVRAMRGLEGQSRLRALSFLDDVEIGSTIDRGFGGEVRQARLHRLGFLREQGYLGPEETLLSPTARSRLADEELNAIANTEALQTGRAFRPLGLGDEMDGKLERILETGQGRLGLVGNEKTFTLVPWRSGMDQGLGRELTVKRRTHGVDWELGRGKGLSR